MKLIVESFSKSSMDDLSLTVDLDPNYEEENLKAFLDYFNVEKVDLPNCVYVINTAKEIPKLKEI